MSRILQIDKKSCSENLGFTLVELSIVLVIIGLIIGGVMVGRDLINSAGIRAQVSQMEKLYTAVNTFKLKYGGIPGDLLSTDAQAFGLFASINGPARAWGDNNGILEAGGAGCNVIGLTNCFYAEFLMLFRQLSDAQLIDGMYSPNTIISNQGRPTVTLTGDMVGMFMPPAKIGHGAFITVTSYRGMNYFNLSGFNSILTSNGYYGLLTTNPLSAQEANSIDSKIDYGKPNSGSVLAIDLARDISSNLPLWVTTSAIAACVTGGTAYTLSNETTGACSLSFRFK